MMDILNYFQQSPEHILYIIAGVAVTVIAFVALVYLISLVISSICLLVAIVSSIFYASQGMWWLFSIGVALTLGLLALIGVILHLQRAASDSIETEDDMEPNPT